MSRNVVLVCGGRDFDDYGAVDRTLKEIHAVNPITVIVEGGALGADCLAHDWALSNDVPSVQYSADWGKYGSKAGPIRNRTMLADSRPNLVVAFPGGSGTAHMVKIAKAAGVEVREIPSRSTSENPASKNFGRVSVYTEGAASKTCVSGTEGAAE